MPRVQGISARFAIADTSTTRIHPDTTTPSLGISPLRPQHRSQAYDEASQTVLEESPLPEVEEHTPGGQASI